MYAEANIAVVWLVDVNAQIVEVYQQPKTTGYQYMQKFTGGDILSIPGFPDIKIIVKEIFGRHN